MRDTIVALRSSGQREYADILDKENRIVGTDINACVGFLGAAGLVTQEWVDRLARFNKFGRYDEEYEELIGYLDDSALDPDW